MLPSTQLGVKRLLVAAAILIPLLSGCGDECQSAIDDLNEDRNYPLDSAICENEDWQERVSDLQQTGRDLGWYNG